MSEFQRLYLNEDFKTALANGIAAGRHPHAIILTGPVGSGKHMLASLIAMALACTEADSPCGHCRSCRLISEKQAPDIKWIGRESDQKKSIGVETVRSIREAAYITPVEFDFTLFIIEDAHTITHAAQNALLKILEEPPSGVYFILLATSSGPLLPTILSRAPVFRMQLFSDDELRDFLLRHDKLAEALLEKDAAAFSQMIHSASGTIGGALKRIEKLSRKKSEKPTEELPLALLSALTAKRPAELFLAGEKIPSKRDEYNECLENLSLAVRDIIAAKSTPDCAMLYFSSPEEARSLAERITLGEAVKIYQIIDEEISWTSSNLNINLSAVKLLTDLKKCLEL